MVSTPIYSFNLTDPWTHNSIYTMPYSLQQSCPRCISELSKVTLKYNSGSLMLWEAYRNQSACHWLMVAERGDRCKAARSQEGGLVVLLLHVWAQRISSVLNILQEKSASVSQHAHVIHGAFSLGLMLQLTFTAWWDCVAGCLVWLKLFSHWPQLDYQRKVSLSWCHTAAARVF